MDMQICKTEESQPGKEIRLILENTTVVGWYLLNQIKRAARLQAEAAYVELRLKEVKDSIVAEALNRGDLTEEGSVTYIVDGILCRVSSGYDYLIPPESKAALQGLLGNEFYDLVDVAVEYRPRQRLIEMACDGDKGAEIRKCLSIRLRAPQVTILQESRGKGAGR